MRHPVAELSARSGLPLATLARRSGLSRGTLYRADADPDGTRLGTLRELAIGAGCDLATSLVPLSDPDAARAARVLLEAGFASALSEVIDTGPDAHEQHARVEQWRTRLVRVASEDPRDLVQYAGRCASPLDRRGAQLYRGKVAASRVASAADAAGARWALSGSAGLAALGRADEMAPLILWTEDAAVVERLLADVYPRSGAPELASLIVADAAPDVFYDAWTFEGLRVVAPIQAVLDGFGLGAADAADAIIAGW